MIIDNLDHKTTIHWISTNTPQKELHQIVSKKIEENFVLRFKEREREREKKPSSY